MLTTLLRSDGSGAELLYVPAGGSRQPTTVETLAKYENTVHMNGREVFKFATRVVDKTVREMMRRTGWTHEQLALLVPHQANSRIIDAAAKTLGLGSEKVFSNLEHYGNTSAATIPIAIVEAVQQGRLKHNDKVIVIGFGAGLTWAAAAITWGQPRPVTRSQHTVQRMRYGAAGIRSRIRRVARSTRDRVLDAVDSRRKPGD